LGKEQSQIWWARQSYCTRFGTESFVFLTGFLDTYKYYELKDHMSSNKIWPIGTSPAGAEDAWNFAAFRR
jgi:hypothetical protein